VKNKKLWLISLVVLIVISVVAIGRGVATGRELAETRADLAAAEREVAAAEREVAAAEREVAAARADLTELKNKTRVAGMLPAPVVNPKPTSFPSVLISAAWLRDNKARIPNLRIIDLRPAAAYAAGHIPGAVRQPYVGVGALRVTQNETVVDVRRTIEDFEERMGQVLGIRETDPVVIYAAAGEHAGRMLWELNLHGHFDAAVLNGLFPAWVAAGGPVSVTPPVVTPRIFVSRFQPQLLASNFYIESILGKPGYVIVDNRPHPEWAGVVPGLAIDPARAGRIPGAISWPLEGYLTGAVNFTSVAEFVRLAEERGITRDKRIIITCRTGSRSSGLYVMLVAAGYNVANHDHSWIGWHVRDFLPRER
jgi:thiosulfate/3-mercaptopyruvate sulfurtransferase